MHWILQENLFKETEWETLVKTLQRFNLPYTVHKVIPFVGELVPDVIVSSPKVICFGSYSLRHAAKKHGWTPGVYDVGDKPFQLQRDHWGEDMLNYDSVIVQFQHARITEPSFMRPVNDTKVFPGRVVEPDELTEWQHKVIELKEDTGTSLQADTAVQICSIKEIYAEYRFWIVRGQIITASLYKRGRKVFYSSDVDERFYQFVQRCIQRWQPDRAFVIDVCETPDGIKIVEINTINSAGFYAANVLELVYALEEMERASERWMCAHE